MKFIYFDHNSFTPPLETVIKEMNQYISLPLNASSIHFLGQKAFGLIESAREEILEFIGGFGYNLIFTSSATEANNFAINKILDIDVFLCSDAEHKSVNMAIKSKNAVQISIDSNSLINQKELYDFFEKNKEKRILCSIIYANNETGAINNLEEIIKNIRKIHNKTIIHSDLSISVGKFPINIKNLDLDMATFVGYKFGGILGCGALVYRKNIKFEPFLLGGGQESKLRAGTENTLAIHSMKIALQNIIFDDYIRSLRCYFEKKLKELFKDNLIIFANEVERIDCTSYFAIKGINSKKLIIYFNNFNIYISSGSACNAGIDEVSEVLKNMKIPKEIAECAVRVSFAKSNTFEEIDIFIEKITKLCTR